MKEHLKRNLLLFVTSILTSIACTYALDYLENFPDIVLNGYLKFLTFMFLAFSILGTFNGFVFIFFYIYDILED